MKLPLPKPLLVNNPFPSYKLTDWFLSSKRDLPWRNHPTPYRVWISEVMLQQTQVKTVIPYFERWMHHFPDIPTLAQAPLEKVIKLWEGLGYYARARNLHFAANQIMKQHNGQLPDTAEALKTIKGLGPYTIGAILSFAFHKPATTVDGNVKRVICRFFAIHDDIAQAKTHQHITQLALSLLPQENHWIFNEALMELGATICQKKSSCSICHLQHSCLAKQNNLSHILPFKKKKMSIEKLYTHLS